MNEQKKVWKKTLQTDNLCGEKWQSRGEKGTKIKMIFQFLFYLTTS